MTTMRTTALVLLVAALGLSACGRRSDPVPPRLEGAPVRPAQIEPGPRGIATSPRIVPTSSTSAAPGEVRRNPNAERRSFVLDGLLN